MKTQRIQVLILFGIPALLLISVLAFVIAVSGDDEPTDDDAKAVDTTSTAPLPLTAACPVLRQKVDGLDDFAATEEQFVALSDAVTEVANTGDAEAQQLAGDVRKAIAPALGQGQDAEGNRARFTATTDAARAVVEHCGQR